ncbi:MAG: YitT family protein [Bacteroidales bacterium]|nr:YitT family protein [Bacteroidales bacterium]
MTPQLKLQIKEYILLTLGCATFSLGAVMLIEPYGFAPGGTYGLSMVAHHLWGWRTEATALCMDIPLLLIGTFVLGGKFGFKTLLSTLLIPFFMWIFHSIWGYDSLIEPGIYEMTGLQQHMLAAIFGSLVYGVGLGMIYRSRATSGGSDIIAMIMRKFTHLSMGTCTIVVDGLITMTTILAFGDWRLPMYSWIIIFIESKVMDRILDGAPSKTMMIITDKVDEVKSYILNDMERGATLLHAEGMYTGKRKDVIYVIVSRTEMVQLRYKVAELDPKAFINVIDSKETLGEGFNDITPSL